MILSILTTGHCKTKMTDSVHWLVCNNYTLYGAMYNVYHITMALHVFTYVSGMYHYHSWYDIYSNRYV